MKNIAKYIFELGTLKRIKRGWMRHEGVGNPESVADHSHRTAILGFILAKLEGADAEKVIKMCLFHDAPETRMGDLDKVQQRYINHEAAEKAAIDEQYASLPENIRSEILLLFEEMSERKTKEAIISRDSDTLELLFQAKEYADAGYKGCNYWLEKGGKKLRTESAKGLYKNLIKMNSTDWWKGLESLK